MKPGRWRTPRGIPQPDLKVLFITGYAENAWSETGHLDRHAGDHQALRHVGPGRAGAQIIDG
jgi:hypothetical protein